MEGTSSTFKKRKMVSEAAREVDESDDSSSSDTYMPKGCITMSTWDGGERKSCHHCKRNNKGPAVTCTKCKRKTYCTQCILKNYPRMNEADFCEACPFCREICNCKSCLHLELPEKNKTRLSKEDKVHYSKYLLKRLLPFVRQFNQQQILEREMEAKIRGLSISDVQVQVANCPIDERMNCDYCRTSIADYHRSCTRCSYDLCITCCQELRDCCLHVRQKETVQYVNPGVGYLHGETCKPLGKGNLGTATEKMDGAPLKAESEWKAFMDGSIPCPPESMGGCGKGILKLNQVLPDDWLSNMLVKAENIYELYELNDMPETPAHWCSCYELACDNKAKNERRKAASRDNSDDNFLYSPSAIDIQAGDLKHFQTHWSKGEPVIVSSVLDSTYGLSWEPTVMSRAIHAKSHTDVTVINCLNWCEVDYSVSSFFKGYTEGILDLSGWPQMLKLNDWPPSGLFKDHLPRHNVEFISALPFKEYTHPQSGYLNLVVKLPDHHLMPDTGPKLYTAYGFSQELGRGDSVTKINCHDSDMVHVLTDTKEMTFTPSELVKIKPLKEKHYLQDQIEIGQPQERNDIDELEKVECGALWDIYRREDASLLNEYLRKHFREFRHTYCLPLKQTLDPILDGEFYLNEEHKKNLKKEYGIEPWTVVQNLGDAVLIPAGCACQVRYLKSCIQVSSGFVSPENVDACLRLTEEIRVLPQEHMAKEDKLGVKKLILYAMRQVLDDLTAFTKMKANTDCVEISCDSSKESGYRGSDPGLNVESDFGPPTRLVYARRQYRDQRGMFSLICEATPVESDFEKEANMSQVSDHVITNRVRSLSSDVSPSQAPRSVSADMAWFFKQLEEQIQEGKFDIFRVLPPPIILDEEIIQEYEKNLKKHLSGRLLDLAKDSNLQDFNKVLHFLLACRRIPSHLEQGFLTLGRDLPNLTSRVYELHKDVNRGMVMPLARSKEKEELKSILDKYRQVEDNLVKLEQDKDANLLMICGLKANQMKDHNSSKIVKIEASDKAIDAKIVKFADEAKVLLMDAKAQHYKVINLETMGALYEANVENVMDRLVTMELKWKERVESLHY